MAGEGGRTWRTWQLAVVAAIALTIGIVAGTGTKTKTTTVSAGATATTEAAASPTAATKAPTTTKAPATTVAPTTTAVPTWVTVATLGGSAAKRSDNFHLTGAQARLRYKGAGSFLAVYVVKAGDSLDKSGGFPEVTCSAACDDQTRLAKGAGDYYLDVSAIGTWSATVEELR